VAGVEGWQALLTSAAQAALRRGHRQRLSAPGARARDAGQDGKAVLAQVHAAVAWGFAEQAGSGIEEQLRFS
jgi:hypothetical protein